MRGIYLKTYRGRSIYRYPASGYGDESNVLSATVAGCESLIDGLLAEAERTRVASLSDADRLWESLSLSERNRYRREFNMLPESEQDRLYTPMAYALEKSAAGC